MSEYQRKDKLYHQAKEEGYRSRAAYKLKEIDKKYNLIKKGSKVVDLGCAPGGWLQVVLEKVGSAGLVVGIDLEEVAPFQTSGKIQIKPVLIHGDILDKQIQDEVIKLSHGGVDIVLSDMSHKLTGIRFSDGVKSAELVETAFTVAKKLLKTGGSFIAKVFPSPDADEVAKILKKNFKNFSRLNLDSSRKTSNEFYFVARDFKGQIEG